MGYSDGHMPTTQSTALRRRSKKGPAPKKPRACPVRLAAVRAWLDFAKGAAPAEEAPPQVREAADRRLFAQMLRGMVRHKRLLEAELARLTERPVKDQHPELTAIALLGLYQLRFLERVPPHAAVFETVALAAALGHGRARGWVNAILRRAEREREASTAWVAGLPTAMRSSHPDWLVAGWRAQYGERLAERICEANNIGGGATLRVETGRISPHDLLRRLSEEDVTARPHPLLPGAVMTDQAGALLRSASFREGLVYVQDVASQLLMAWCKPLFKGRVLDACAAPGGKLTWLAGLRAPKLQAMGADITPQRLRMMRENFARLRLAPQPLLRADGRRLPFASGGLDGVILDVPCSATGMIRKYPELKWRKQPSDMAGYVATQRELLNGAARLVRPGGWLLYATCSLEEAENQGAVATFLAEQPEFSRRKFAELAPPKGLGEPPRTFITREGDFQTLPAADRMGFYGALLVNNKTTKSAAR